jgi:hypothetical protein
MTLKYQQGKRTTMTDDSRRDSAPDASGEDGYVSKTFYDDSADPTMPIKRVSSSNSNSSASDKKEDEYVSKTFYDDSADPTMPIKRVEPSAGPYVPRHSMPENSSTHAPAHAVTPQKKKRKKHGAGFFVTIVVVVLLCVYFAVTVFYQSRLLPGTFIDTVDCSNMSVAEAKEAVRDYLGSYQITIDGRESSETIAGSAFSMSFDDNGEIDAVLSAQNRFSWPLRLVAGAQRETVSVVFDQNAAIAAINALACMDPENMRAPSDVHPAYDGNSYHLVAADYGTTLDGDKTRENILAAISDALPSVDLDATGSYVDPAVTESTPELEQKIDYYNTYVPFSITYTVGDDQTVLDGNTAADWLVFDSSVSGGYYLDEDKVDAWVTSLGDTYDTVGTTRTFTSMDGSTVTVSGGTYGWEIDHDAEVDAIMTAFENHTCETREPIWEQTAASHEKTDWGDTYMEVSISDQHWWAVQDGQVVLESDCVTGLPTAKRSTPTGVYDILDKQSPYTMHGDQHEDGSYDYVTKCKYWMRVTWTGVGFHDASWQPWFGGNRYTYAGSHGCINCPTSAAKQLYDIVEVGWPVIIHK